MTVKELAKASRSFRGYDHSYKFTKEQLLELVDCVRYAPSSVNRQPLKFYLSWEEEEVARIQSTTGWAKGLPDTKLPHPGKEPTAFIVICLDTRIDDNQPRYMRDIGIDAQMILLAAAEQGLGGCMIGSFQAGKLREYLKLSEHLTPLLVVALGKPDEEIRLVEIENGEDVGYYRDENDVHYVPKRKLSDIVLTRQ